MINDGLSGCKEFSKEEFNFLMQDLLDCQIWLEEQFENRTKQKGNARPQNKKRVRRSKSFQENLNLSLCSLPRFTPPTSNHQTHEFELEQKEWVAMWNLGPSGLRVMLHNPGVERRRLSESWMRG